MCQMVSRLYVLAAPMDGSLRIILLPCNLTDLGVLWPYAEQLHPKQLITILMDGENTCLAVVEGR